MNHGKACHLARTPHVTATTKLGRLFSSVLACPHCSLPLDIDERHASCLSGHSFDRAKEGYLNLLVGGRVPSTKTPGDTTESLSARRRFLHSGWYSPIVEALRESLGTIHGPVLDVGCGEGYYLSCLTTHESYALDISKRAVQMTSKLLPETQCIVGTSFRLPIQNDSLAAVYTVFAPHSIDEYRRVLRPGGVWVTVTPGPQHLIELRPQRDEKTIEREDRRTQPPEESEDATRVQCALSLTDEAALDLVAMTPLQFQTSAHSAVEIVRNVTVDVWVSRATRHH